MTASPPQTKIAQTPEEEEEDVPEFSRVATFDADDDALNALVNTIRSEDGPPDGVPATRVTVLADRSAGKVMVDVRFGSEEDLRRGAQTLDAMSPPPVGTMRRLSVDVYEVMLERVAP